MIDENSAEATQEADLRLEMKVKNNVLWRAIYNKYGSIASFCNQHPLLKGKDGVISELLRFKSYPFKAVKGQSTNNQREYTSEYRPICLVVANALQRPVEQLFPIYLYDDLINAETERVVEVSSFTALPMAAQQIIRRLPAPVDADNSHQIQTVELRERIQEALKTLTYREREIIKLRYGLGDGHTYSLDEVAKVFKVGRERIRQIEKKAIRKLQSNERAELFATFIDPFSKRTNHYSNPVEHTMHLDAESYDHIKSGIKKMEVRLFDQKRQKLNVEDTILFNHLDDPKQTLKVVITALHRCLNFQMLLDHFDAQYYFGRRRQEVLLRLEHRYSKEQAKRMGVLGIEVKVIGEVMNVPS